LCIAGRSDAGLTSCNAQFIAVSLISDNWQALQRAISLENALRARSIIGKVIGCSALR